MSEITETMISMKQKYGCQIIVNGVTSTLKYYLRLLENTDKFIYEYVRLMEDDAEISFDLKREWNALVA